MNQLFLGNSRILLFKLGGIPTPGPVEPTPDNGKVLYKTSTDGEWLQDDADISDGAFNGFVNVDKTTAIKVIIPSKDANGHDVTSIGSYAFSWCTGLMGVTIANSVTSIEYSAFYNCTSLTNLTIPNSVTSIGNGAFVACSGLTSVTIPDSVTSIGNGAFVACSGLTSVTIPDSVTSIGANAFAGSGLTSVTIVATGKSEASAENVRSMMEAAGADHVTNWIM